MVMAGNVQVRDSSRAAGTLAAALAVLALIACALAPAARAETVTFGGGHLDWGVKQTFRQYIEGPIAHGQIDAYSGATRNQDGTFRFPVYAGSYEDAAGSGEIRASGSVRFIGHDKGDGSGPELEMTISDPVLVIDGEDSVLRADVVSKPKSEGADPLNYPGVELADLDPAGLVPDQVLGPPPGLAFGPAASTLAAAAAPVFSLYEAGVALDPVSALALLGDPGDEPEDEPPPPLPTSPERPQGETEQPAQPPASTPVAQTQVKQPVKPKRCKKGFRKVKVKGKPGKTRCVKKKSAKKKKQQGKAAKKRAGRAAGKRG